MKLTHMQRKYLLRAALILLLIAGSYLVLWSHNKGLILKKKPAQKAWKNAAKRRTDKDGSGEMIWETFPASLFPPLIIE